MMLALTREVSDALAKCELTHLQRVPIDVARARQQHRGYERALEQAGCRVVRLPAQADLADSVFIEDTAVVLDDVAVITRPGAQSRRRETAAVVEALRAHRPLRFIEAPATVDGGDVLVAGRDVFVGLTTRTNAAAVAQLRALLPGHRVTAVEVGGCLHLKSAVTAIGERRLLLNPAWVRREVFAGYERVEVDPAEPAAANALRVGETLVFPSAFPRTAARLPGQVVLVDADELAKAEGAVTCCALLVSAPR